jgi:hypothetical protein
LTEPEDNSWISIHQCIKSILQLAPALQGIQDELPGDLHHLLEEISKPLEEVNRMLDKMADPNAVTIHMAVALIFNLQVN